MRVQFNYFLQLFIDNTFFSRINIVSQNIHTYVKYLLKFWIIKCIYNNIVNGFSHVFFFQARVFSHLR